VALGVDPGSQRARQLARGGDWDRVHLLDAAGIDGCAEEQAYGPDRVLPITTRLGLGFMLPQEQSDACVSPNPRAFGHPGAGGSLGFADPNSKIGFGYVINHVGPHILLDARAAMLIDATYASSG
jgi:CubicO group peptidase (beta-lactamase class C family)